MIEEMMQSPSRSPRRQGSFWTFQRALLLMLLVGLSLASGAGMGIFITYLGEIPLVSDLKAYKPVVSTKIFDSRGNLITELFSEQRTLIRLDDVPKQMQQAVISIEDNNFFQHVGIQFSGILRSLMVNFLNKSYQQGGSTITQQLARNMFLTRRKTIERKIKEIILALQIERTYSKKEILEMYLNQIYFGNGAYGIESASRAYFGKHTHDLTLPECALLAGLPRAPNAYNPYRSPEKSIQRRNLVLSQMQRLGYLSSEEAEQAKQTELKLSSVEVSDAPYFVEYVRRQLEDRFGSNAIYKSGLQVYTSLDLTMQQIAQDAMTEGLADAEALIKPLLPVLHGREPEPLQCSLILLEPATGEIKALIGGRDFQQSKFNRAVQAERQPGSAFKPFIYATAIANGFTQADIILDAPVVFRDDKGNVWKPENFSNKFRGPTTLRTALTHSRNVVTVKLLNKVGIPRVIDMARKLGIRSPLKPYLTLALGASEVNLLELVSAYGCFSNRGIRVEPVSILRVLDVNGQILEENTPYRQEALDESTAAVMTNLLENVVNHGTGAGARRMGFTYPAGGKTGTTNDYSDAWFLGFTNELVAGVWLGLDSHQSMGRGITGGKVACPIWTKLMLKIYAHRSPGAFSYPDSVELVNFCSASGQLPNPGCKNSITQGAFAIGTAPSQHCDVHVNSPSLPVYNPNTSPARENSDSSGESAVADEEEGGPADSTLPEPANTKPKPTPPPSDRPLMF